MASEKLEQSLNKLEENAAQLPYEAIEKIKRKDFESIEDLKAFAAQLVESTTQVLLDSLEKDHNSLASLKAFVENLVLLTRLLQQTAKNSEDDVKYLHEVQSWFGDEVLGLLLNEDVVELVLASIEATSQDDTERPPRNPPPPRFLLPRRPTELPPHNPPPPHNPSPPR